MRPPAAGRDTALGAAARPAARGRLLAAIFLLALSAPFFTRIEKSSFHGDETGWVTSGQKAVWLILHGRGSAPEWRRMFIFSEQPQVGKYVVGAGLWLNGYRGDPVVFGYNFDETYEWNRAQGLVPGDDKLRAARLPVAFLGWLTCALLFFIGKELGHTRIGVFAAIFLAANSLWLTLSRQAMMDTPAMFFATLAVFAFLRAAGVWQKGRGLALGGYSLLTGLALGLALGTKYSMAITASVLAACLVAVGALCTLRRRWLELRRLLLGAGLAAVVAAAVFYVSDPSLYHLNPARSWHEFQGKVDFLRQLDRDLSRGTSFEHPDKVMVEIADRTLWPLHYNVAAPGAAQATQHSFSSPLQTLALVLGLVAAALLLARRLRSSLPQSALAPLLVLTWFAGTYLALAFTLSIWWDRWHLPLAPPLALLAGLGLHRFLAWARLGPAENLAAVVVLGLFLGSAYTLAPEYGAGWQEVMAHAEGEALVWSYLGVLALLAAWGLRARWIGARRADGSAPRRRARAFLPGVARRAKWR